MIDENAYGIWLGYYDVEDDEYVEDDTANFVQRFRAFETTVLRHLTEVPVSEASRTLCLGHGVYIEFEEGEEARPAMPWVRGLREALSAAGFVSVAVLCYGSRWIAEAGDATSDPIPPGSARVQRFGHPSEPLRRALYADAATRPDDRSEGESWGPGFYVDVEAIEALGKTPKNAPTVLYSGGAGFYRVSR